MVRHTERELLHELNQTETDAKSILSEEGMPDGWEGGWTSPESLSECVRLADGAQRKVALARDSSRRGDHQSANIHHAHALALLKSVRKLRDQEAKRRGRKNSVKAKQAAAEAHWANPFYALAYAAIKAEGKKTRIGGNAINDAAWNLARNAGVDAQKLEELTPDRARGWIKRNPS